MSVNNRFYFGTSIPTSTAGTTSQAVSGTNYLAFSINQAGTKDLSTVEVRVSAASGLTSLVCELQADASGVPSDTALATSTMSSGLPSGATNFTFTGFTGSPTMSDGATYWLVLKNSAAGSVTYDWLQTTALGSGAATGATAGGFAKRLYNGSNWTSANATNVCGVLVGYTDSSYEGFASVIASADNTRQAFGSNEIGCQFTVPSNVSLNVREVLAVCTKNTSPTGNLTCKIYTGASPSLQATSVTAIPPALVSSTSFGWFFRFASIITLTAGTVVTITIADSAADDSSNCYRLVTWTMYETGTGSVSTYPFQGTMLRASYDGASWSTSNAAVPMMGLLLDSSNPFL